MGSDRFLKRYSTEQHWEMFTEFCRLEKQAKGPDQQIPLLVELSKDMIILEKIWLAGCYAATHCIPTAYIIWQQWRPGFVEFEEILKWIVKNKKGLPVRPERKSIYIPGHFARCVVDFSEYSTVLEKKYKKMTYDDIWEDSISSVKYYARYMAIKYIEILRNMLNMPWEMPDIRPKGAWSPRLMLSFLYPEKAEILNSKKETEEVLLTGTETSLKAVAELKKRGVELSLFDVQVLLCEYREIINGGFYSGASLDEEIEYIDKAEEFFPGKFEEIFKARRKIFDNRFLGEMNSWHGIRRELWRTTKEKSYIWSDLLYEYKGDKNGEQLRIPLL